MSSLAGALDETHVSSYQQASYASGDAVMGSPIKEEYDPPHKIEGDQDMDDLFGNDQEVIEPKHEEWGTAHVPHFPVNMPKPASARQQHLAPNLRDSLPQKENGDRPLNMKKRKFRRSLLWK
jgi:hypothetical protein